MDIGGVVRQIFLDATCATHENEKQNIKRIEIKTAIIPALFVYSLEIRTRTQILTTSSNTTVLPQTEYSLMNNCSADDNSKLIEQEKCSDRLLFVKHFIINVFFQSKHTEIINLNLAQIVRGGNRVK